uniref:Reverse transcriptase n=1 Tax=Cannabis sativa TaxID=3483 RepID=A0A803QEP6_CANSA
MAEIGEGSSTMMEDVEALRLQFLEEATLELEADFEISAEVAKAGVLVKLLGNRTVRGVVFLARDWPEDGRWQDVCKAKAAVWVQIHGLPTPFLVAQNSTVIGAKVGEFIETDRADNKTISRRGFLKLRVDIRTDAQLPAGFYLSINRDRREWIQFKYCKIPMFCLNCGYLDHNDRSCSRAKAYAYPPVGQAIPLYGPWLKASVPIRDCFDTRRPAIHTNFGTTPAVLQNKGNAVAPTKRNIQGTEGSDVAPLPVGDVPGSTEGTIGVAATTQKGQNSTVGTPLISNPTVGEFPGLIKANKAQRLTPFSGPIHPMVDLGPHTITLNPFISKILWTQPNHPNPPLNGFILIREWSALCGKKRKAAGSVAPVLIAQKESILVADSTSKAFEETEKLAFAIGSSESSDKTRKGIRLMQRRILLDQARDTRRKSERNRAVKVWNMGFECLIFEETKNALWTLYAIYGPPYDELKSEFWEDVARHINSNDNAWAVLGDLNLLHTSEDKSGGRHFAPRDGRIMNEFLFDVGGVDIGFSGCKFTWRNKRENGGLIRERLDRAIANPERLSFFPRGQSSFRVIGNAWNDVVLGDRGPALFSKLQNTRKALQIWKKEVFSDCDTKLKLLETQLQAIQSREVESIIPGEEKKLEMEIFELWKRKESMLKQRSRELWLSKGDRNSSFFHAALVVRRRRNYIHALLDENNSLRYSEKEKGLVLNKFFSKLFTAGNVSVPDDLEGLISHFVSAQENSMLMAVPLMEEIRKQVFLMHPLKAPGPDGFSGCFYRHCWDTVGEEVTKYVQEVFQNGVLNGDINHTFLCLIPKGENPKIVDRFRPIALCNFVYKIISRIISQRLKIVMDRLVSPNQSAFIPGRILDRAQDNGEIHGIKISRNAHAVSHLMFADDTLLFTRANTVEAGNIGVCLKKFEDWSGQLCSKQKSGILFSRNCVKSLRENIEKKMGISTINEAEKYLGNPFIFSRKKKKDFEFLRTKLMQRLEGSKMRSLSFAGRMVAVKAIASAIPSYSMSTYQLPITSCRELDVIIRKFWWSGRLDKQRFLATVSWDSLCRPKVSGGLGFRRMEDTNQAFLAKFAWCIASGISRPWTDAFKAKYFPRDSFWSVKRKNSDSFVWKGILNARQVIMKGSCTVIASGASIDIWHQPWIPWLNYEEFRDLMESIRDKALGLRTVADLLINRTGQWNSNYLCFLFGAEVGKKISTIQLATEISDDLLIWKEANNGMFSVKQAYMVQQGDRFGSTDLLWKWIWNNDLHPRMKMVLWRALAGALPIGDRMGRSPPTCCFCSQSEESLMHMFVQCPLASALWLGSPVSIRTHVITAVSLKSFVLEMGSSLNRDQRSKFLLCLAIIIDSLWFWEFSQAKEEADTAEAVMTELSPLPKPIPMENCVIFVDGSFKDNRIGAGFLAWNRETSDWFYGAKASDGTNEVVAEVYAWFCALQWAKQNGWDNFALVSDSTVVIKAFSSGISPNWKCVSWFAAALKLLNCFSNVSTFHFDRTYLAFVDSLAKSARCSECDTPCYKGEGFPPVDPIFSVSNLR